MTAVLRDLSGRVIPSSNGPVQGDSNAASRVIAVPPVRDVPNEQAQEFLLTGYATLPAAGAGFVGLTDPSTGLAFAAKIADQYRGRIDSIMIYCPDMIAAAAPYLTAQLTLNQQLAPAWGIIPIFPRNGVASISFDVVVDLQPNMVLRLNGWNQDAVNTHLLGIYLHGWQWPKSLVEG